MPLRIPWDIEEAVLMLDMLLKSLDGNLTRKEAIHQVSTKLRRRAVNRGLEIDEIFRNENGVALQMAAMKVAYTGIKTKLKQPTRLFIDTVELYRKHKDIYRKILEKILKETDDVDTKKENVDIYYHSTESTIPAIERTQTTVQDERQRFSDWMLNSEMAKATIPSYMSSVKS